MHMIEQVTEQINKNAESAAITTKEADQVGEKINVCNGQMQEMAEAMRQISFCSGEIQHIIKTIDDIAFQTNILALNAAVEAARAGAAGKDLRLSQMRSGSLRIPAVRQPTVSRRSTAWSRMLSRTLQDSPTIWWST